MENNIVVLRGGESIATFPVGVVCSSQAPGWTAGLARDKSGKACLAIPDAWRAP
jgi:hypothetical protein